MKEDLISFKTAKLAKEKGFNISGTTHEYDEFGKLIYWTEINLNKFHIPAPTQSLLQKWLREVHNIHVTACKFQFKNKLPFHWELFDQNDFWEQSEKGYNKYEEALEIGLQKALKLIS